MDAVFFYGLLATAAGRGLRALHGVLAHWGREKQHAVDVGRGRVSAQPSRQSAQQQTS